MQKEMMTREGHNQLKAELERLEGEERLKVAEQIAKARAYGDLSENFEYQSAKEAKNQLEVRIAKLRGRLKSAQIVETPLDNNHTVSLGHRVRLQDLDSDRQFEYQLVGQAEADVAEGKISVQSPVGQGLFGRKVGESVVIQAPSRTLKYKILNIG